MIKNNAIRSCGGWQSRLFQLICGATILAAGACAEIEFGSTVYKNITNTKGPTGQPARFSPVTPDAIDTTLRADPESFYASGLALWDGDRTLAGIWIAHPMAQVARQVRLTNNETGTRVDAAMFRRDPNLSGPRIVVSSEAARLLGLTPDLGTGITIEGLAYGAAADTVVASGPAPEPVFSPADAQTPDAPTDPALIEVTPVKNIGPDLSVAPEANPPAATPPEPELASAATVPATDSDAEPSAEPISSTVDWEAKDKFERTRQTQTAAIPIVATEVPLPQTRPATPAPVSASLPEPAPAASGGIADGRRYIQAGVFGLAENAARLVEKLRAADLPAKGLLVSLGEKQFTRVVIGPFETIAERNAALEVVRAVGPPDATPVRG